MQTFYIYNLSPYPTSEMEFYTSTYQTTEDPTGKRLFLGRTPIVEPGETFILETRADVPEDSSVVIFYEDPQGEPRFTFINGYIGMHARKVTYHLQVVEKEGEYWIETILDEDLIPE